jgi:uncharacterized pyridoxamine 5'-phosphate oxidase family protein
MMKEKAMNTPLNVEKLKNENLKVLHKNKLIYLATACEGRVKSRVVDYHNEGLTIGFITWTDSIKIQHMKRNPLVSLCIQNLQIEGKAKLLGHPGLEENKEFTELYKERHPTPFNNFIQMENVSLVMVEPLLTIMMIYEENYFYLDHLDVVSNVAFRRALSPWNFDL